MSGIYRDKRLVDYSQFDKPHMREYLQKVRERNRLRLSTCNYCPNKSIGIIAIGAYIKPVCKVHKDQYGHEEDC